MIQLKTLTAETFYMNEDQIEIIESMPDTLITMTNGKKYYAAETPEEIVAKIIGYKKSCLDDGDCVYFKKIPVPTLLDGEKCGAKNSNGERI